MSDRLYDAFEVCLAALQTGVDLETCLELYPDLAAELRPALEAALAARSMAHDGLPAGARQRSRARVLGVANAMRRRWLLLPLRGFPRLALAGLAAVLAAFLGVGGLVAASAQSLPGDALYPIKRAGESLSLELSGSAAARQSLREDYSQRRSSEIRSLLEKSRSAPVSFQGVVRQQTTDSWLVGNIPVRVPKDAQIIGTIEDGVTVEVDGETHGGDVQAHQVRLKAYELDGPVQAISGAHWTVAGTQLVVDADSIISPGIGLGDNVIALLEIDDQGHTRARAILRGHAGGPETQPKPSVTPSATPTPMETEAPNRGNQTTDFSGILQSIAGSTWTVGGRVVRVGSQTEIDGNPRIGDTVKVRAAVGGDGSLQALKIQVITGSSGEGSAGGGTPGTTATPTQSGGSGDDSHNDPVTLTGTVTAISVGSWTVAGQVILVNGSTEIRDNPAIGDTVKVTAQRQADGSLLASKIERASS